MVTITARSLETPGLSQRRPQGQGHRVGAEGDGVPAARGPSTRAGEADPSLPVGNTQRELGSRCRTAAPAECPLQAGSDHLTLGQALVTAGPTLPHNTHRLCAPRAPRSPVVWTVCVPRGATRRPCWMPTGWGPGVVTLVHCSGATPRPPCPQWTTGSWGGLSLGCSPGDRKDRAPAS